LQKTAVTDIQKILAIQLTEETITKRTTNFSLLEY